MARGWNRLRVGPSSACTEAMRVGYIHDWKSNWFVEKGFDDYLAEDVAIRDHINGKLAHAGLSDITIRKDANEVRSTSTPRARAS